jgi:hypothetical protein
MPLDRRTLERSFPCSGYELRRRRRTSPTRSRAALTVRRHDPLESRFEQRGRARADAGAGHGSRAAHALALLRRAVGPTMMLSPTHVRIPPTWESDPRRITACRRGYASGTRMEPSVPDRQACALPNHAQGVSGAARAWLPRDALEASARASGSPCSKRQEFEPLFRQALAVLTP